MILLQDAVNIVPGVRGDQNVRNREGNQQSQRDLRPAQYEATLAGSTFVSMKKHKGRGSSFSAVALRGLGGHDFSKRNQPRRASDWAHRVAVVAGLYRLDFEYSLTVGMALEQSCELCNSPSGKPRNCPVQGEPNRLKLTRQALASRITGRVVDGEVGRGRGRQAIKVRRLVCRCCRRGRAC